MAIHHEKVFGDAIVAAMCADGWIEGDPADYRPELGLDTRQSSTFIGAPQPDEWEEPVTYYGGDHNEAQRGFALRLDRATADDGLLDVLRKGVRDHGVRIRLAYCRASLVESDAIPDACRSNRLTMVRDPTELIFAHRATRPDHRRR
ncbi:hypothetical protein O7621_10210 [Solwaraspora sp. WMMD937]|uniref:hypothetical protein n=1 Tax=Solwaraspora sp. WMMD937 TaxID=3016090 RepID=UPI00249A3A6D|nr:hypothetical protein [Solwaraspora sp. WMMD937]WFE23604.1 hypothetical protein O7621_10210 [Solwaraspora sp. WMMD937]